MEEIIQYTQPSSTSNAYSCLMLPTTFPTGASTDTSKAQWSVLAHQQQPAQHLNSRVTRITSCQRKWREIKIKSLTNCTSMEHFTNGLRAYDKNLVKFFCALILIPLCQSSHNFAHVTTAELSWHVRNCVRNWWLFLTWQQLNCFARLQSCMS